MDKETKKKLREAGWSEEGIVELDMEEEKVTISRKRYNKLKDKAELYDEMVMKRRT